MFVSPMRFGKIDAPFNSADTWAEMKADGYRVIAEIDRTRDVRVWTRNGNEIVRLFPELRELADLVREPVIIDGELCVLDERGHPRFELVRSRSHLHTIVAFDATHVAGVELLDQPLEERRAELERVVVSEAATLLLSRIFDDAVALYAECEERGIEGIVIKRKLSKYVPSVRPSQRSKDWWKCRTSHGERIALERRSSFGYSRTSK